jgi:hypothetical protein
MKTIKGYLRRLGESTVDMNTETKTYSLIEVGDLVITGVKITRKLANFVSDGVGQDVTLHMHGSGIVACEVNGKTYYESQFATSFGTILALVSGAAGAFLLFMVYVFIMIALKIEGGGASIISFAFFAIGAVLGYNWGKRKFATPKELAEWKAQGAIAV